MATARTHLELAAKRGSMAAQAALEAPEFPEPLRYLYDWCRALHARSGVGMNGFAPLTWTTLDAWSRMTGNRPTQNELDALFILDAVLLTPPKEGE